jgi:thiol-disulfide isomerase/thioredoxin
MSSRLAVIGGLVAGIVAAGAILVGLVALVPDPGAPTAPPTVPPRFASASPPGATQIAGASPSAGASNRASASAPGSPGASPDGAFGIGEAAPPLDLPQVGGGRIALAELRGRPVWINFMATWCPPCVDEFPLMNGFAARHAEDDLIVIAVDVREDEGTVAAFAERLDTQFPIGLDAEGDAQAEWGATALPVHFWIDADGIVRDGALGGIGPDVMAEGLRAIMPGVEVTP